jgi:hypothetical protein
LAAIGTNSLHRTGRITLDKKYYIDISTGEYGLRLNSNGSLEVLWRDILLVVPQSQAGDISPGVDGLLRTDQHFEAGAELPPGNKTIRAERECQRWLTKIARKFPEKNPFGTFSNASEIAAITVEGLSKRGFERAWAQVMSETGAKWNLPGRPTKSPR